MNDLKILMAIVIITLSTEALFSQENRSNEIEFETDATSLQSLNGLIASQRFGASVANCGDVNGDGYDDIISGAHLTNSNTGKAYIYFGGVIMSSTPAIVLNGEGANNYFGLSVSSAGDVNGDGYNDVIVGAYGYSSNTGRAYIYYGGYNMDNVADIVITGPGTFSFGYTVSSAGDVNGDGFSDVIISGHAYSSNKGRAYICYGGLIMDNTPDKILEGAVTGGFFGFALSGAGDVNGDGYSDVIIGAYAVSSFTGAAYLYYGGASMDTISDVIFSGEASNSFLGQSVTGAGDVNGDGYSDLLIGASLYSASTGRAYLYYGSGTMDNTADVTFTGEGMGNNFGRGLAGVGDVNGDGYSDIFIGAQSYSGSKGRAYLYYGGVSMNNISDMKLTGESGNNYFGFSLAGGGDINGDGYKDFLAGAYGVSSNKGKVYIYKNSMTGNDIPDVSSYGEMTSSNFGISVSDAGDVNGDGYGDYIAGAGSYGNFARGKAYIYFGSVNPDTIPDLKINGLEDFSWFGLTVSGIGDINADGYDDIAVGAPEYDNGRGRVYIYYGGSVMDTVHDASITGTSISSLNKFGQSISSGGDMNGDGFSDIIIGSPGYLNSRGLAQIFFGGSPLDTIPDYSVTSGSMNEFAGTSVACAGDINSDGYSDVLIGVPGYSVTGKVYVVFGGNSFSLRSFEGQTGDEYLGYSVSGAGDVNGDGYSDFVVGAPYGNNSRGKSYLYHGGVNYDFIPDVEFSTGSESEFGVSVSGAGDLNNDGYDDVLISELGFNFNSGRAFIYFGGYAMNNAPDILMNANYQGEEFGFCVSIAGDINGDGTDDVLIGAPLNEKYGVTGAAYLYLSSPPSVEPILISVKDVPNDQGGKVFLKWTRSAYDITGTDMITDYLIQRSLPPGSGGFFWENISNIPATRESYYGFTDNTPFDSLSGNSGTLYYRITARTNNQNNFWRSNIVFGRSIDNIAPLMVSPFTAAGV
ncbi:MAG TPA: FG-GAP-like repeat-containing protein, partial [Ignavibacteria bacterium]|nr:FG-GAP-like repeat-containing protein [Ignavibacteria bacterium]